MGATGAIGAGMGLEALGSIFGASSQAGANNANLEAAQANRAQLVQGINSQMMSGQNPYSQAFMQALQGLQIPSGEMGQGSPNPGGVGGQPGAGSAPGPGVNPASAQQAPALVAPSGVDASWWNSSGEPTFSYYFQQVTGRVPTQGDINQFGAKAAAMSWDDVPGMLQQAQASGQIGGSMGSMGQGTVGVPGGPSFNMAPGNTGPTKGGPVSGYPGTGIPAGGGAGGGGGGGATSGGLGTGQPQSPVPSFTPYNPLNAALPQNYGQYNPAMMGAAPTVGAPGQVNFGMINPQQLTTPQIQMPQAFGGAQLATPGSVSAQQVQAPGQLNLPSIQAPAPIGTQGMNAGQDALMQMMRANLAPPSDGALQQNLQNQISGVGGGGAFDPSGLLAAQRSNQKTQLDQQVAALQGSAGSLGQRFGTAMLTNEANLRTNLSNQFEQTNQQTAMNAFENAAGRSSQALGLQQGYQQSLNQLPFQQAQLQQQAAQAGGGLAQQASQTNLQAQIQNSLNSLQAQQANQGTALSAGMQGQQLAMQGALANQGQNLAAQQFNVGTGLQAGTTQAQLQQQAGLQGQSIQAQIAQLQAQLQQQAGQSNQGAALQAGQYNQGAQLQAGSLEAQQQMQAALANQGYQYNTGAANQGAANQGSQFNANLGLATQGFNAQQGQLFNTLQQSLLSGAQGSQMQQQQYNAGLLSLLAGLPMPQQQASPWGAAIGGLGSSAMTMGLLQQFLAQNPTK